jgi:hypothetical protein
MCQNSLNDIGRKRYKRNCGERPSFPCPYVVIGEDDGVGNWRKVPFRPLSCDVHRVWYATKRNTNRSFRIGICFIENLVNSILFRNACLHCHAPLGYKWPALSSVASVWNVTDATEVVGETRMIGTGTTLMKVGSNFVNLTDWWNSTIFWEITPCSPLRVNRRFGGTSPPSLGSKNSKQSKMALLCLSPAFTLVSCSANFSTLEMETICSSETSVHFQRTTRHYIREDGILHNHRCENFKS